MEPLTVKQLIDIFIDQHVSQLKNPRSLVCRLNTYFAPLHDRPLHSLTVLDLVKWRNAIKPHSTVQASACLADLRNLYNKAIEWDLYHGENIAARVKNERNAKRSTYIREHEMPRVIDTILAQPFPERLFFYAMLVLAPRPKELEEQQVAHVQVWKQPTVDGGHVWRGLWIKPRGTTKTKKEQVVPLPATLAEMYAHYIPTLAKSSKLMFPGRGGVKPVSKATWFERWDSIREVAGVPHIWCYDLRRSGSTWANDTSGNLAAVSKGMLGHASYQATDHYVQVMDGPVLAMLNKHEERLLKCGQGV